MVKLSFKQLKRIIANKQEEISFLNADIDLIKENYLEDHALPIGTKVKITTKRGKCTLAIISNRNINLRSKEPDFKYEFLKLKKDGTPSKVAAYMWLGDKFEVL
jgi:hypothetical protein